MSMQLNIIEYLKGHQSGQVNAQEVADYFGVSRNAASHHLNRLVDEGTLVKTETRPTLFSLNEAQWQAPFSEVVGARGSLKKLIEKFKAAVKYPTGLPILLQGKSGTGKSFLAKEIYEYAKNKQVIPNQAPFILLNCADYANNPELLSSVLFGHVRGAFTGAETDKNGLLKEANNGFLFLDEVHNLSAENQEKLFLFMDSGRFRPLGENEVWHESNARLIMATTENADSSFLPTFVRRIPFVLTLPEFAQRPYQERRLLIDTFIYQECRKTQRDIWFAKERIEKFSQGKFQGNIGQLKNQIKVMIAENISRKNAVIHVPKGVDAQEARFYSQNGRPATVADIWDEEELLVFQKIESFKQLGNEIDKILFFIKYTLKNYYGDFEKFYQEAEGGLENQSEQVLGEELGKYGIVLSPEELVDLRLLLDFFQYFDIIFAWNWRLRHNEKIKCRKYLYLAQVVSQLWHFEKGANAEIKLLIAAFLKERKPIAEMIPAVIVMHGEKSAESIAQTANQLLGNYIFDAFNMPIDVGSEDFIKEINQYIKKVATKAGIVVLVDMGSLSEMYSQISHGVEGDLLLVNNVSTALALDIGNKIQRQQPMERILDFDESLFSVSKKYFEGFSQKPNILISCMSGVGIAVKVKEILEEFFNDDEVELLTMDYQNIHQRFQNKDYQIFRNTLAILSTPGFKEQRVPIINIEDIVKGSASFEPLDKYLSVEDQKICRREIVKLFTIEGAGVRLTFLNPEMVINEVGEVIAAYEEYYQIEIENFLRMNLFLHLSSMIERILKQDAPEGPIPATVQNNQEFTDFVSFSNVVFRKIRKKYNIQIPLYEYSLVFQLINELSE